MRHDDLREAVADLRRRIDRMLRVGTVAEVSLSRARVRVRHGADETALTDWLPWLTARAGDARTWWAPSVGEGVLVLAPSGELSAAVVLPALFQEAHPPPADHAALTVAAFPDGAAVSYDADAGELRVQLPSGGKLRIDGDVEVAGSAEDAAGTMEAMRTVFNAHTHPAPGGATSPPTRRM